MAAINELTPEQAKALRARIEPRVVRKKAPTGLKGPCMIYDYSRTYDGRCIVSVAKGHAMGGHKAMYLAVIGPVPEDPEKPGKPMQLHFLCGRGAEACVNPHHLEPITQSENLRRQREARTHCQNNHEYTPENTRWQKPSKTHPNGTRICKTCAREATARYLAKDPKAGPAPDRCRKGHDFTEENTLWDSRRNVRRCRTCSHSGSHTREQQQEAA